MDLRSLIQPEMDVVQQWDYCGKKAKDKQCKEVEPGMILLPEIFFEAILEEIYDSLFNIPSSFRRSLEMKLSQILQARNTLVSNA
ncbi:hypothetical protein TNIN_275811 [Trichonephila inaurata madagascariensis]|uniref:Uncharacterized protein n=1 Tax=Trichonephila inaurata madagascariensis TaxID=2747483 RepID=A0A8X6WVH6_9ARAC|nr:hypothetical protein TNIN_275811 [Trichonephila inaurata madagascariensis]